MRAARVRVHKCPPARTRACRAFMLSSPMCTRGKTMPSLHACTFAINITLSARQRASYKHERWSRLNYTCTHRSRCRVEACAAHPNSICDSVRVVSESAGVCECVLWKNGNGNGTDRTRVAHQSIIKTNTPTHTHRLRLCHRIKSRLSLAKADTSVNVGQSRCTGAYATFFVYKLHVGCIRCSEPSVWKMCAHAHIGR